MTGPPTERLPEGFTVRLAAQTRVRDGGRTLIGGSRGRVVYLKPAAVRHVGDDGRITVSDPTSAALARLLLDRGLAHPSWGGSCDADADAEVGDVTVVVPVRDREPQLRRLLDRLPRSVDVVVVDDGSSPPVALDPGHARVRVLRHEHSRGPAAARNTGLAQVATPYAVFVDSDVVPVPGWLARLRAHFDDPAVGIVGPRVVGLDLPGGGSWLSRYEAVRSSLDLGPWPSLVEPQGRVAYLSSACLMARVSALGDGFDAGMHVAEDVDLVWRVSGAAWRVRYEPSSTVQHEHRTTALAWVRRKAFYGTGASRLAQRHGAAVAPMVLAPWTAVATAAVLAQRRWSLPVAGLACAVATHRIAGALTRSDRPVTSAAGLMGSGVLAASAQAGSALTRHYWPLAALAAVRSPRARHAITAAAVVEAVVDYRRSRPDLDPVRFFVARRVDDVAYGCGLWWGAVRDRCVRALLPDIRRSATSDPPSRRRQLPVRTGPAADRKASGHDLVPGLATLWPQHLLVQRLQGWVRNVTATPGARSRCRASSVLLRREARTK